MSSFGHTALVPLALRIGQQRAGLAGGLDNMLEALPRAEGVPAHAPPEAPAT